MPATSAGMTSEGVRTQQLLQPHVLGEVVRRTRLAFEAPTDGARVVIRAERLSKEALLRGPTGVGLRLAITARHGVVEPAVRRVPVNMNVVAFLVRLKAVAEAAHVIERNDVVGLAEG